MTVGRHLPVKLNDLNLAKRIRELGNGLKMKKDEEAFRKVLGAFYSLRKEGHGDVGAKSVHAVIQVVNSLGKSVAATKFFEHMVNERQFQSLNQDVMNAALRAYSDNKDQRGQAEVFALMNAQQILPNAISFTEVIRCQHGNKNSAGAWDAYQEALHQNIKPNAHMFAILIRTVSLHVAKTELLPEMKKHGVPTDTDFIIEPLMSVCVVENNLAEAERLFETSPLKTAKLYKALLHARMSLLDSINPVVDVLKSASRAGHNLPNFSYAHVIKFCIKHYPSKTPPEQKYIQEVCELISSYKHLSKDQYVNVMFMQFSALVSKDYFKKQLGRYILRGFPEKLILSQLNKFELDPRPSTFKSFRNSGGQLNWKIDPRMMDEKNELREKLLKEQSRNEKPRKKYSKIPNW
eukprot:TRINITY_DN11201_c0_g1_i1.p1 TRINITY_DN11201_c0_g1~~TRINITY_DN11201_c0_g1_i1.p1  ORF type:complete len:406 (+),score=49.17 TRINITY_DN11201_c0_g1_i1:200-1417(+)